MLCICVLFFSIDVPFKNGPIWILGRPFLSFSFSCLILRTLNFCAILTLTAARMQRERLLKVLVIGDLGVGKTSIIKRYVHHVFSQHYRATIGVDFSLKVLNWDHKTVVRLQLWDIAGA